VSETKNYTGHIATFGGHTIAPFDPNPEDIYIEDIAHALSMQCRFTGHTKTFYSVGQHSFLASEYVEDDSLRLWALLHDGTEAYLADIARPVKAMWPEYKVYEDVLMKAIIDRFGLVDDRPMPKAVKDVDDLLLANEIRLLMPEHEVYQGWDDYPHLAKYDFEPWTPADTEDTFLQTFYDLGGEYVSS
jgi:hypothetical protein